MDKLEKLLMPLASAIGKNKPKNYGKVGPQILLSDRSIDFLFILA